MILMDGYDKKDLEEAVEKVLNLEHEERKRELMGTHPPEKKDSVKEATQPEKKKNKMKHVDVALLIIVIAGLLIWMAWPSIVPEEPEIIIVHPANVVLASFDDSLILSMKRICNSGDPSGQTNGKGPVAFQLKNTGDEVAMVVSCFIKCCDQNGTILFAQLFTFDDLGPNNTVSGAYDVPVVHPPETLYIAHSIEVRWSPQGVNTYMKLTGV